MAADGSAVRQLTRDKASDISPTWSPDGKQLVFATNLLSGGDGYDLWVMDVDGGDVTLLTTSASEPDWSPDGRRVAAVFHFPGVTTIGLVPVDGNAGPQPLLEMQGSQSPAWSPEGVRIIFSAPAEGGDHLHTINPDGSDVVDLSAAIKLAGRQPTWSRDARDVAFVATVDGNQDIWIAAIDGGRPIRLTDDPGRDASPSWSP